METKTCTGCLMIKDVGQFRKGGRRCKACIAEYSRHYYALHREEIQDNMRCYQQNRDAERREYHRKYYKAHSTHATMYERITGRKAHAGRDALADNEKNIEKLINAKIAAALR